MWVDGTLVRHQRPVTLGFVGSSGSTNANSERMDSMTWVRRIEPRKLHQCTLPLRKLDEHSPEPVFADGEPGDLWRCDVCGKLWEVVASSWRLAGWRERWRYRHKGWPGRYGASLPPPERGQMVASTAMVPPRADAPPPPPPLSRRPT